MRLQTREVIENIEELMEKKPELLEEEEAIKAELAGVNDQITALEKNIEKLTTTKGEIEQRLRDIQLDLDRIGFQERLKQLCKKQIKDIKRWSLMVSIVPALKTGLPRWLKESLMGCDSVCKMGLSTTPEPIKQ